MPLTLTSSANNQEKHLQDVYALLFHNHRLYSAAEDGKIKVWHPDLKLESEFQAHETVIYHIAAIKDTLYTCSNDGTIKAWCLNTLKLKKTLLQIEEEILRLYVIDTKLYSGDSKGVLNVWENDNLERQFNMVEEIRDFAVAENCIYTVRDRDVCIHELLPGDKGKYMTRMTLEGSSPLCIVGNKLCFAARSGTVICVHDNNRKTGYKELSQIQAHEMIMNTLYGSEDCMLFSGGYDGKVKQWNLDTLQCVNTYEMGSCINSLCTGPQGQVYVAGGNGILNRLDNK